MKAFRSSKALKFWCICISFLVVLATGSNLGLAAAEDVNLETLIKETQKITTGQNQTDFVWWIPQQFWQVVFDLNKEVSQSEKDLMLSIFEPYTLMIVASGIVDPLTGKIKYQSESEICAVIKLIDSEGNSYQPFQKGEVNAGIQQITTKMKPLLVKNLGAAGKGMHFILFTSKNSQDQYIINPYQKGSLAVQMKDREFKWKLPLESLLKPQKCPTCGETLNGAYQFCPWDGSNLK